MLREFLGSTIKKEGEPGTRHDISESVLFGVLLALVGGFLDAYTFISRGGVFANAQTGNIVLLGVYAAKGEWSQALAPVPPILAFIAGVFVTESLKNNSDRLFKLDSTRVVLLIEIIVLFIIGFIPTNIPNNIVTVTVSFVSSIQISSFRKLVDTPYATTMSTGNLRTASQAAYIAFTKRDRAAGARSIRFFTIILTFILGAFWGGVLTFDFGVRSIWAAVIVLVCAVIVFSIGEREKKK